MEQNDIFKHLELSNLYIKSEICLYYFFNCLVEHELLMPNFKNKYDVLRLKYEQVFEIMVDLERN